MVSRFFSKKITIKALIFFGVIFFMVAGKCLAAPVYDYVNGTYTDDFSDATGMTADYFSNMEVASGTLHAINPNSFGTISATAIIMPQKISRWGTLTIHYQNYNPDVYNGSFGICVRDEQGSNFGSTMFPCDMNPIDNATSSTGVINLSTIYPDFSSAGAVDDAKIGRIMIFFSFRRTSASPALAIDSITLTWTPQSGDLSASPQA